MSNKKQDLEKIDEYLFGLMSAEEQQAFDKAIQADKALAEAVALQKMEHRTMQLLVQKELKANLNEWKKEKLQSTDSSKKSSAKVVAISKHQLRKKRLFRMGIAATITLLVGFISSIQWANHNYGSDVLATNTFRRSVEIARGSNTDMLSYPTIFQPALSAMLEEDYTTAIELLSNIQAEAFQENSKILQAECHFKLGQYDKVITICNNIVSNSNDESNIEKAEWYLTLAYFSLKEKEKANLLLNKILKNKNHAFYPYALDFEKKMNSFWGKVVN